VATLSILYDADCGFCRWSLAQLLRLDRRHRLRPLSLQESEAETPLAALPAVGDVAYRIVAGRRSSLARLIPAASAASARQRIEAATDRRASGESSDRDDRRSHGRLAGATTRPPGRVDVD
jgi:predicted DCC family thiol-disulfide oxidoreductase YuxK